MGERVGAGPIPREPESLFGISVYEWAEVLNEAKLMGYPSPVEAIRVGRRARGELMIRKTIEQRRHDAEISARAREAARRIVEAREPVRVPIERRPRVTYTGWTA